MKKRLLFIINYFENFKTRKNIAHHVHNVWEKDMTDIVKSNVYNDGFQYILFVDLYSRY